MPYATGIVRSETRQPGPQLTRSAIAAAAPATLALQLLLADVPQEIIGVPENWPRWAVLLPHVLAATGHIDDVALDGSNSVELVARLLERAGVYLRVHARVREAWSLFERGLRIDEASYGPDHTNVATDLVNLASVLRDLGEPAAARPLVERACASTRPATDSIIPIVATDLNDLAVLLVDLGEPAAPGHCSSGRAAAKPATARTIPPSQCD